MSTAHEILESIRDAKRRLDAITKPLEKSLVQWPLKIIQNAYLTRTFQHRFPRCKSKRIAKKWRKNPRNFRTVPSNDIFVMPGSGTAVCHPDTARRVVEQMKQVMDKNLESSLYDYFGMMFGDN